MANQYDPTTGMYVDENGQPTSDPGGTSPGADSTGYNPAVGQASTNDPVDNTDPTTGLPYAPGRTGPATAVDNPAVNENVPPTPDSGAAPPAAPTPAPASVDVPSSLPVDPAQAAYNASLRQSILDQLNGDLSQPETADSSDIAPAISAYTTQSQKDEQSARDQLAESAYASNGGTALSSGGFQTSLEANRENMAGQRSNFVGNAVMQGQQNKRTQLASLLNTAVQYGDTQTAQQIQSQISLLDAQLQEQGLNQSFATSNNDLGFNYASLIAQENRDALLAGMDG